MIKVQSESSSNDEGETDIEIRKVQIKRLSHLSEEFINSASRIGSFSNEIHESNSNYRENSRLSSKMPKKNETSLQVSAVEGRSHIKESSSLILYDSIPAHSSTGAKSSSTGKMLIIRHSDYGDGLDMAEEKALNQSTILKLVHEQQEKVHRDQELEILKRQKMEMREANERREAHMRVIREFEKDTSSENEEPPLQDRIKESIVRHLRIQRFGLFRNGKKRAIKALKSASTTAFRK
jgi:hypothetical protein